MKPEVKTQLLTTLKERFEKNIGRHKGVDWTVVRAKLEASPKKLQTLSEMENTGGEPDVIGYDKKADKVTFCDCSPESPRPAEPLFRPQSSGLTQREQASGNAVDMASSIGIEILTEEQYRELQRLGEFDLKTSSWVRTPTNVRELGGALFCDRRFGQVFVYHNGAESYYAARGFRGRVDV
jgi:hypothetical protein